MSKTLLHILNTGSYSGAENVVITIIEGFRKYYPNYFSCVYVSIDGTIRDVLKKHNIIFEPISDMTISEIIRVKKKYKPDIIHAHDFTASIICAAAAGKVPVISHIHNNSPWIERYCLNSFVYGLSCIKYKKILGVSTSVFDEYVFGRFIRRKSSVIGNPIDISKIRILSENADINEGYDVVFLGRLTVPKDPLRFIDIIAGVKEKYPEISAVMIGDGELRQEVEKKISYLGLGKSIALKGFVSNPYGILKNSKMLCIPSKWEGFGLAAVEALALGKPVLASPVGGLPEIVNNNCGGLCKDKQEFVDLILDFIYDKQRYAMISFAANKRAEELNNIKFYLEKIINIYIDVD